MSRLPGTSARGATRAGPTKGHRNGEEEAPQGQRDHAGAAVETTAGREYYRARCGKMADGAGGTTLVTPESATATAPLPWGRGGEPSRRGAGGGTMSRPPGSPQLPAAADGPQRPERRASSYPSRGPDPTIFVCV